jgi:hypothetical protein
MANRVPAGFLKVTKEAVDPLHDRLSGAGLRPAYAPSVDLFNHGAHKGVWYGEDYAFSRNWCDAGGEIWARAGSRHHHHAVARDGSAGPAYPGNFHRFLLAQPQPEPLPQIV